MAESGGRDFAPALAGSLARRAGQGGCPAGARAASSCASAVAPQGSLEAAESAGGGGRGDGSSSAQLRLAASRPPAARPQRAGGRARGPSRRFSAEKRGRRARALGRRQRLAGLPRGRPLAPAPGPSSRARGALRLRPALPRAGRAPLPPAGAASPSLPLAGAAPLLARSARRGSEPRPALAPRGEPGCRGSERRFLSCCLELAFPGGRRGLERGARGGGALAGGGSPPGSASHSASSLQKGARFNRARLLQALSERRPRLAGARPRQGGKQPAAGGCSGRARLSSPPRERAQRPRPALRGLRREEQGESRRSAPRERPAAAPREPRRGPPRRRPRGARAPSCSRRQSFE